MHIRFGRSAPRSRAALHEHVEARNPWSLAAGAVLVAALAGSARAATLCVNPGGTGECFASIQAALDARTGDDDLIQVDAGTYSETLRTRRHVQIQGAGAGVTIIEARAGTGPSSKCGFWTFQTQTLRLSSLTIRRAPPPNAPEVSLCVDGTDVVVIEDVVMQDRPLLDRGDYAGRASVIRRTRFDEGLDVARASGTLTIEDSWLVGTAQSSALSDTWGSDLLKLTILRSTLSGGTRGIDLDARVRLIVQDSTISGNLGSGIRGGDDVRVTIESSTITDNGGPGAAIGERGVTTSGVAPKVKASIIARNANASGSADCETLRSRGFNVVGSAEGCEIRGAARTTLVGVDPLLGPLQDNGGFGYSHLPLPGSPALGLVLAGRSCKRPDQTGSVRAAPCDAGAIEVP